MPFTGLPDNAWFDNAIFDNPAQLQAVLDIGDIEILPPLKAALAKEFFPAWSLVIGQPLAQPRVLSVVQHDNPITWIYGALKEIASWSVLWDQLDRQHEWLGHSVDPRIKQGMVSWFEYLFFVRLFNILVLITDTLGITDVMTWSVGKVLTLADTVDIADVIAYIGDYIRVIADTGGITDVLSPVLSKVVALSESLGITDVLTNVRSIVVAFSENLGITDVLSPVLVKIVALSESLGITDVLTDVRGVIVNFQDSLGITDVVTRVGNYIVLLTDTITLSDIITSMFANATHYLYAKTRSFILKAKGKIDEFAD